MRRLVARGPGLAMGLLALVVALTPLGMIGAGAAPAPILTLEYQSGLCTTPVIAFGQHFPPGAALVLAVERLPGGQPAVGARTTVRADGMFGQQVRLDGCDASTPVGTQFGVTARLDTGDVGAAPVLAGATFTITFTNAWAAERARVPADWPVYRPTWLPTRYRQPPLFSNNGLEQGVIYVSDEGDRILFGLTGNSCGLPAGDTSQTVEPYQVHGITGSLVINTRPDCAPRIGVFWQEAGGAYAIQANAMSRADALSRAEMRLIVDGLAPVGADGDFAPQCFPATGKCATGRFFAYWLAHGGLAVNGYPISDELTQTLEDGKPYTVQYFERVRLERHPENQPPYDVLLGQLGRRVHPADPPAPPRAGATYFAATGHNVAPDFLAYWQAHGGLAQFGYPLSEEIHERLADGKVYTVQYFERARFERHPENPPPYDIELGQLGRRILAESGR
ncbi:MAG TPA: hypothetical protein VFW96_10555 [Thermomicrobiales bacterium]|nr:hypothetical protein [Thermomicrobiales bacterium]